MNLPKKHANQIAALINTIRVWDAIANSKPDEQAFRAVNRAICELEQYGISLVPYINTLTGERY